MARLLIVSRSMALAMRLADQHEVNQHPVDDLEALGTGLDADVLVLDLGDPMQAVTTVNDLREAGQATPVLLVSGYQPEWEQVEAQQVEGVVVVPLPITRSALLAGIAQLTGSPGPVLDPGDASEIVPDDADHQPDDASEHPEASTGDDAQNHTPSRGQPVSQPVAWGTAIDPASVQPAGPGSGAAPNSGEVPAYPDRGGEYLTDTGSQAELGPPSRRLPRLGNRPRKLQRRPNITDTAGLGLVTDPLGPRTDPYGLTMRHVSGGPNTGSIPAGLTEPANQPTVAGPASSSLDRRLDADAVALVQPGPGRGRSSSGIVMRPADLVQSLLDHVGDLYGVSDTAQVLADDVIERADADAAAILVPDGPVWRVSGGVGLRPLERRLILENTHWLITEIGAAGRAVLIDDTDIIRPQLSGAPLAAWRHLLAVPVPEVRAIVVLARGQEAGPFTDRDLAAVIAPVREAAALLAQAVQTRRLARALSALRETEPASEPPHAH